MSLSRTHLPCFKDQNEPENDIDDGNDRMRLNMAVKLMGLSLNMYAAPCSMKHLNGVLITETFDRWASLTINCKSYKRYIPIMLPQSNSQAFSVNQELLIF